MNYASVVVVFFTAVATAWYFVGARKVYKVGSSSEKDVSDILLPAFFFRGRT